ncbi:hypothetical protein FOZ63_031411, partial [Perkinsus olseni]
TPAQRNLHSAATNWGQLAVVRFEELNEEASGKTDQSPEAAKAEKELDENPAMKEAKKIAENPVEEDAVVNQIEASGVSTPEPAEPVPTEAPEEEAADKKPPEPVKIDVNRESGGEIYSAALDHAVKAKMDIKPRDKFDMEAHRQKLVKRVEDIREGHQKEHAKQVEEAAKSDDNSVDAQSFIEQADCPGGNCPEETAAPAAGSDEEAVGEENKEPPCEEGYDSSSRKKYKPCPYKPVWDDPTADKMKIERALKGSTAGAVPKTDGSTAPAEDTTGGESKALMEGGSAPLKTAIAIVGTFAVLSPAMRTKSTAPAAAESTDTEELERPVELSSEAPLSTDYEPNHQAIDISATWNKDEPVLEPQGGDFESLTNSVSRPRQLKPTEPKFHAYKPEWNDKQFPVRMDKSKYVTGKVPVQQTTEGLFDSPEIEDLREQLQTSDDTLIKKAKDELGCDHGQSIQAIKDVSENSVNQDNVIQAIDASASFEPEAPPPVQAESGV